MTLFARIIRAVPLVAAVLFVLAPVPAALAQDSMQLDVEFKESLTRGTNRSEESRPVVRPRSEVRAAQARIREGRRPSRKHLDEIR